MIEQLVWRRWRAALLVAVAGAFCSGALSLYQTVQNQHLIESRLSALATASTFHIKQHLGRYLDALQGLRGVVLTAGPANTGAAQLNLYLASLAPERELISARSMGFIRRVSRAEESSYVREQQALHPHYLLREFHPHSGDRYVVQTYRTLDGGQPLEGLDLGSDPLRRRTADLAMQTGEGRLTPPIMLYGSGETTPAFLLMLPVYRGGAVPHSDRRDSELAGWTYSALRAGEIVRDVSLDGAEVSMSLDDITDELAVSIVPRRETGDHDVHHASTTLDLYGRRWRLTMEGSAAYIAQQHLASPFLLLLAGLAITAALVALVGVSDSGRRRRHELIEEQARLAAVVDSSADAIMSKDMTGKITSWNRGAERLFGYTAQQAVGQTVAQLLVPPHLQHEERALLQRLAAGETIADVETQRLHRDGHLIDVWVAVAPVRRPDGMVIGASKTVRDITERKAAELRVLAANVRLEDMVAQRTAQLRDTNLMLYNVLDAATGVAIIACGMDGVITVFNRGAERMLGYPADQMLHQATPLCFHDQQEVAQRAAELSLEEGRPVDSFRAMVLPAERGGAESREWTYIRRDGSRLTVSLIVTAMHDGHGRRSGYLGVAMDITEQRSLLASLERAKEEALAASAAKSNFLANMSHEIRTPMNAVLGMLQLVQGTTLGARQRDYLIKADGAARSLLQLLNDVLDYSKIEANKLRLDQHTFEVDAMLRELAVVLGGNQCDKQVEIVFDLDPALPPTLVGDRLRLQQILINLAGNALKFTEQGHVKVSVEVVGYAAHGVRLRVAVADTGIGISADQQARIFDGFTQAEASVSRRYGGTGLGLVISRRLLNLMGSTLELESQPGHGSCFWFELMLGLDVQQDTARPLDSGRSLLIVHNHPQAGAALQRMATGLGWQTTLATTVSAALTLLAAQTPDVVLADLRLPARADLMTGLNAGLHCVPVVLVGPTMATADAAFMLSTPTTPQMLSLALQSALDGVVPEPQAPPLQRRLQNMRILLVEDNQLNREVAGELLSGEGAQVTMAENGHECLDYLLDCAQLPDVVLMDMQMPAMDGLEATRLIRTRLGPGLRIIAMTANAGEADRDRCLTAGMNEHVGKPIDLERLVACLLQQHSLACAHPATTGAQDDDETLALVLSRFGGNLDLYRRALAGFLEQAGGLLETAQTAVHDADTAAACMALHTYKGLAATLGARQLARQAAELEQQVRSGGEQHALLEQAASLARATEPALLRLQQGCPAPSCVPSVPLPAATAGDDMLSLEELLPLLAAGNLRALEWAHTLAGSEDTELHAAAQQIQAFDFPAASATLKAAIRRREPQFSA